MARQYTAEQIIEALRAANGIQAAAARALGCSRNTIARYIKVYATVKEAYDEANETAIDFAEQQLMRQIKDGNITAIIFFLKTKGKARGYVERQEVTGADSEPLTIRVEYADIDIDAAEATHGTAAGDP